MNTLHIEREIDALRELRGILQRGQSALGFNKPGWARAMDIGGSNGSHHSATLTRLVKKGHVERFDTSIMGIRHAYVYRITNTGMTLLEIADGQ